MMQNPFSLSNLFSAISHGAERIILSEFLSKISKNEISKSLEENLNLLNCKYDKLKILDEKSINKNLFLFKKEIDQRI